jgi:hypothetical protein
MGSGNKAYLEAAGPPRWRCRGAQRRDRDPSIKPRQKLLEHEYLFPLAPPLCLCGSLLLSTKVNLGLDDPDRYEVLSQRPPPISPFQRP